MVSHSGTVWGQVFLPRERALETTFRPMRPPVSGTFYGAAWGGLVASVGMWLLVSSLRFRCRSVHKTTVDRQNVARYPRGVRRR